MSADERTWRIGEVATATGLTVRALHRYDQIGLVVPSARTSGGHRLYTSVDLMLLYQVTAMRQLGLSLAWPAEPGKARDHFAAAISSPGALFSSFTRALYRAIALAGLERTEDAEHELQTAPPADPAYDADQAEMTRFLRRLQNPPFPGLDAMRQILNRKLTVDTAK